MPGFSGTFTEIAAPQDIHHNFLDETMKYFVKHFDEGYQVYEKDKDSELLIASFHKGPETRTGEKSKAQLRAEEYCDFLNRKDIGNDFRLDVEDEP